MQQNIWILLDLAHQPVKKCVMSTAQLMIDLGAIQTNWRNLNSMGPAETAAVIKADGYGLGVARVAKALASIGASSFFVAVAEEGSAVRKVVGNEAKIFIFSGHMVGDTQNIRDHDLIPLINSVDQLLFHLDSLHNHPFGIQLDTGMNRLGLEPKEWQTVRELALQLKPKLIMSHLACADDRDHVMNSQQLKLFLELTNDITIPKSLAATGGIMLGQRYHFDLTRPGIGLYGGLPFEDAKTVVSLDIPVIQIRDVAAGESVGYGNAWRAPDQRKIATISAGYADGISRAMGSNTYLFSADTKCPVVGRISMDLIGVDVSELAEPPKKLSLLNLTQNIDQLAASAGTIGYEVLTSLGQRYKRLYSGASE